MSGEFTGEASASWSAWTRWQHHQGHHKAWPSARRSSRRWRCRLLHQTWAPAAPVHRRLFHNPLTQINVSNPVTFIGLRSRLGRLLVLLARHPGRGPLAAPWSRGAPAVPRAPGIMDYSEKPEYGRSFPSAPLHPSVSWRPGAAGLSRRSSSASASTTSPRCVFGRGILTGQLMANTCPTRVGVGQRQEVIEDGNEGGKDPRPQGRRHRRHGRDPFKDTPAALNR